MLFLARSLPASSNADGSTEAYKRLTGVADSTSLLYVARPWHLKLEVSLVNQGQPDQVITIERWQDHDNFRMVRTSDGQTVTQLLRNGDFYQSPDAMPLPQPAERLLQAVLHPGPLPFDLAGSLPDEREVTAGHMKLTCIMLDRRMARLSEAPLGLFPTYCLAPEDHLNLAFDFGGQALLLQKLGKFLDHDITMQASLNRDAKPIARLNVLQLTTFSPSADEFAPAPEMIKSLQQVRVSGGVVAAKKISGAVPLYPEAERVARASGTVVLQARIGTDGRICDLVPMSAPAPDFAMAAVAAVRTWMYTPYLLNGAPTEILTTITVNFNMRS